MDVITEFVAASQIEMGREERSPIVELEDLQLVLIGGGIGDTQL